MNKKKRNLILYLFNSKYPNLKTELAFNSPFELLISVVLSAQSRDKVVNKSTAVLYKFANTPSKILKMGIYNLKKYIKNIGLYNNKAKNIIKISKILNTKYKGKIPNNRFDLENLPGVGRKTANVVLNNIFLKPTIAVDTHVFRVSNRTSFAVGKNVLDVENKLLKLVPLKFKSFLHNWFVFHGKKICRSKNPKCFICFINHLCEFKDKVV
ncbi:endonuclease III [Buchnera aphidicola (Kurisakia onigurumii)]|uniref:endonuclease III n=1 Tax=Buchnera aphidicola TaxID=9 RepID=UPI0031B6F104